MRLGCREIDLLIALGWLPEGEEANRERVGAAVANALRELGRALTNHNSSLADVRFASNSGEKGSQTTSCRDSNISLHACDLSW